MDRDLQIEKVLAYFDIDEPNVPCLCEILYTFRELKIFPACVGSVSEEQALLLWRIVEKIKCLEKKDLARYLIM